PTTTPAISALSLHDALPIYRPRRPARMSADVRGYRRDGDGVHPPYLYADYLATRVRAPRRPLVFLPHTLSEVTGPVFGDERVEEDRKSTRLNSSHRTISYAV